ncbi:MAG: SufD family Fe-S cluster assembly protein [Treponema sp.]|uniref:SufB/SufD family protein n=1 Tax=Treponema sp. TaxID=166 RepID=UPI00298D6225|nr:SufD family Fe-S cluster assembly protein [Treponema sp.]MBR5933272.1 SufD family Fe-S cluster assembly protein [Treponema sp.]
MNIDKKINNIPSLTWNWLKMNSSELKVNSELKEKSHFSISKIPHGVTFVEDAEKYMMSIAPVETGTGKEISAILFDNEIIPSALIVDEKTKVEEPVICDFSCKDKHYSYSSQIIYAKKDSEITVIMNFSSETKAHGLNIVQTKLYAEKNAKIHLITTQTLGKEFIHVNDIGTLGEENSKIEVSQIELGSKKAYVGVHSLLKEYQSKFVSNTAYYCRDDQELDMNYVVKHTGRKTDCNMKVAGTLNGNSKKTYRGTIDFKNGCQGATGDEQEETLLLSPSVVNNSIPVILCDEEDVAGEHGATIGRMSEDILFYMKSRGINKESAQRVLCQAKINRVASKIPDENTKKMISKYMDEVLYE